MLGVTGAAGLFVTIFFAEAGKKGFSLQSLTQYTITLKCFFKFAAHHQFSLKHRKFHFNKIINTDNKKVAHWVTFFVIPI